MDPNDVLEGTADPGQSVASTTHFPPVNSLTDSYSTNMADKTNGKSLFHVSNAMKLISFAHLDPQLRVIDSPPFDTISSLRFSPTNPSGLLAASWDTVSIYSQFQKGLCLTLLLQTLYYYDIQSNERRCKFDHRAAVLDCCFSGDGRHAYSGGLDTSVRGYVLPFHIPPPLLPSDYFSDKGDVLRLAVS